MRTCPFNNCDKQIINFMFACRKHWFSLNAAERAEILASYNDYGADDGISLDELRRRQQAVLGDRGNAYAD